MTHRDPPRARRRPASSRAARRSTTTRRLDDSGRDSETRAREMAQQAAGAPVTVREAIQVRDEGDARDARVERDRFVARSHLDWIDDGTIGSMRRRDARDSMGWRLTGRVV